jgi:DNA processing protein
MRTPEAGRAVARTAPTGDPRARVAGRSEVHTCDVCLRRTWLIARLAGYVERERHARSGALALLLALDDQALLSALPVEPALIDAYAAFSPAAARDAVREAGLAAFCRHHEAFPPALLELPDPPAIIHVAGDLDVFLAATEADRAAVGVVGARRASEYGLEAARAIGRGLAAAGVPVVSGMALGVDSAAHTGALAVGGPTVAVLAGGADRPYPQSKRRLYEAIRRHGCVVAEMPPGFQAFRWSFPARNRIIAALARLTVVVEARERSGSLITAELARDIGRDVAAVPGRVSSPLAAGTNALLKDGAAMVRGAEDALDLACGVGAWHERDPRDQVPRHLRSLLTAVAEGHETLDALAARGVGVGEAMAGLAELEMLGHVRRAVGGRYLPAA